MTQVGPELPFVFAKSSIFDLLLDFITARRLILWGKPSLVSRCSQPLDSALVWFSCATLVAWVIGALWCRLKRWSFSVKALFNLFPFWQNLSVHQQQALVSKDVLLHYRVHESLSLLPHLAWSKKRYVWRPLWTIVTWRFRKRKNTWNGIELRLRLMAKGKMKETQGNRKLDVGIKKAPVSEAFKVAKKRRCRDIKSKRRIVFLVSFPYPSRSYANIAHYLCDIWWNCFQPCVAATKFHHSKTSSGTVAAVAFVATEHAFFCERVRF